MYPHNWVSFWVSYCILVLLTDRPTNISFPGFIWLQMINSYYNVPLIIVIWLNLIFFMVICLNELAAQSILACVNAFVYRYFFVCEHLFSLESHHYRPYSVTVPHHRGWAWTFSSARSIIGHMSGVVTYMVKKDLFMIHPIIPHCSSFLSGAVRAQRKQPHIPHWYSLLLEK